MEGSAGIEVIGVTKRFGPAEVLRSVDLSVPPGRIVALLGPSGCGKTTLLRIVAGLERPDAGAVAIGGRPVTGEHTFVAPERRKVGMVFQDWALFPHLSVAGNVGYGLAGIGTREERARRIDEALEMVGLAGLGPRLPSTLSGGQQQRVALARALAPQPAALLLDEPFSNLDAALRVQVRGEVHRLLAELGITCVFVTHDQEEAFVLGDEVAVMHAGVVVQQDTPAALYARPVSEWVAAFVGDANLVDGTGAGATAATALGPVPLADPVHGPARVLVRPEHLRLAPGEGRVESAVVELLEYYGHDTVYVVRLDDDVEDAGEQEPLRVRAGSVPEYRRGDRVVVRYAGPPAVAFGA